MPSVTGPYSDDAQGNFAYFVYDSLPTWSGTATPNSAAVTYDFEALPSQQKQVAVYQLITTREAHEESQFIPSATASEGYTGSEYLWEGALVYDGEVYDNIRFRARGGVFRYTMGKNLWKFDFNRGRSFKARDNRGKRYDTDWRKLNFSSVFQQGTFGRRGEQGLVESVGFKLHNLVGNPAPHTHYAHFRIIEDADENGPTSSQFDTDFQGLYLAIEQMDGQFLDDHGLPDGNLYKMENFTGELNNQGPDQPTDLSDLNDFLVYEDSAQTQQWWEDNLNLPDYYNFRAIATAIRDHDIGDGKNYFYFHDPEAGNWRVLNWDLDLTWIPSSNNVEDRGPLTDHVLAFPDFSRDYRNRMREIVDLLFNSDQTGKLLDEFASFVYTPGMPSLVDADRAMWDYNPILISDYVTVSKSGQGRYYIAASPRTFAGMIDFLKERIVRQTASPINTKVLNGESSVIPRTPTITYSGGAGFPTNDLSFQSSPFSDPQGSATFAGMQWRIGEIYHDEVSGYVEGEPFIYEIEDVWTSEIQSSFTAEQAIPVIAARPGRTYRARVRHLDTAGNWSHWSAPVEFVASGSDVTLFQQSLVVSEFMYHPATASAAERDLGYSSSDFEWIELSNVSAQAVDMTSLRFTKGVDFDFPDGYTIPAGGYVIIARNQAAFELRYGDGHPVLGDYAPNNLSNRGEELKLSLGAGTEVISFIYEDAAPWPAAADIGGISLVLIDPASIPDHTIAANWRAGDLPGGSPGPDTMTSFAAWKAATGVTGDAADDDDRDTLDNLLEYATGSNGADAASIKVPTSSITNNSLEFTFDRRIGASDLNYSIEYSTDLDTWMTASAELISSQLDPGGVSTAETWRLSEPVDLEDSPILAPKSFDRPVERTPRPFWESRPLGPDSHACSSGYRITIATNSQPQLSKYRR